MITTLISGGTLEDRLQEVAKLSTNLPYPPLNLDGREKGITIKTVRQWSTDINLSIELNSLQRHFILEAQNLSLPAQHALLKTLEEPPARTQIVLTVNSSSSLLETILSRCQIITLKTTLTTDLDSPKLLNQIINSNYAELIKLASDLTRSNPEIKISGLLQFLREHLSTKPTLNRASAIKALNQAHMDLKTNAQKQLVLEHLFFTLKSLAGRQT